MSDRTLREVTEDRDGDWLDEWCRDAAELLDPRGSLLDRDDDEPTWQTVLWFPLRLVIYVVLLPVMVGLAVLGGPSIAVERCDRAANYYEQRGESLAAGVWRVLLGVWLLVTLGGALAGIYAVILVAAAVL